MRIGTGLSRGPATIRGAAAAAKRPTPAGRAMSETRGEGLADGTPVEGDPADDVPLDDWPPDGEELA
jgi:hypothetical protein